MQNIYEEHIIVTAQIKEFIKDLKVVFPAYYANLYAHIAEKNHIPLELNELIGIEILNEKIVQYIVSLSAFTEDAMQAMDTKNELMLAKVLKEIKQFHKEIEILQKIVYEDTLTKSYNRKWFSDLYLDEQKDIFRKNGILVTIDINDFKHIKDTLGNSIGDKILIYVSKKLKETDGNVVRFGGDKFLVIFDENNLLENIEEKLKTIFLHFKEVSFKIENSEHKISLAYGVLPFHKNTKVNTTIEMANKKIHLFKKKNKFPNSFNNRFDVLI